MNENMPKGCCDIGGPPGNLQRRRDNLGHDMACAYMGIFDTVHEYDEDVRRTCVVLERRGDISLTFRFEGVYMLCLNVFRKEVSHK